MKYLALWLLVAAVIVLIVGGAGLLVQWISADPSKAWLAAVVGAAGLIATIAAAVDFLSDHRTPKDPEG